MSEDKPERQYVHRQVQPPGPHSFRSPEDEEERLGYRFVFWTYFLVFLCGRALWELHKAGHSVRWLILWAAAMAAGITIMKWAFTHWWNRIRRTVPPEPPPWSRTAT